MTYQKDVVHQLFQVSRAMTKHLNHELSDIKVTQAQLAIIDFLQFKKESVSLVDIAKYLNVEKSTVTRVVKHLETNGFVNQVPSTDHREKRIQLSPWPDEKTSAITQTKNDFEQKLFKNMRETEIDQFYMTLLKLFTNLTGDDN